MTKRLLPCLRLCPSGFRSAASRLPDFCYILSHWDLLIKYVTNGRIEKERGANQIVKMVGF
jgi:hypothetical protein